MNESMEKRLYHIITPFEKESITPTTIEAATPFIDSSTLNEDLKVINVTSEALSVAKSMTAYYLARDFARQGHRTLLVELDFYAPKFNRWFFEASAFDVFDAIQYKTGLDVAVHPLSDHLDVLCSGEHKAGIRAFFLSRSFKQFIHQAKASYDKVIIDAPLLNPHKDVFILRDYANATIIVHARL